MNDLISRQAAINAVYKCADIFAGDMPVMVVKADAYEALAQLPPAQPEQRWIPCSKRMPYAGDGESDNVIATCGYMDTEDTSVRWIRMLCFNGENWCYPTGERYGAKVYAWMPLPKPWKGEQNG